MAASATMTVETLSGVDAQMPRLVRVVGSRESVTDRTRGTELTQLERIPREAKNPKVGNDSAALPQPSGALKVK